LSIQKIVIYNNVNNKQMKTVKNPYHNYDNLFKTVSIVVLLIILPVTVVGAMQFRNIFSKAASDAYTYKVVQNHQWTCNEQPEWGNYLKVIVRDENGNPVPGVEIQYWHDNTANPHNPHDGFPAEGTITTGGNGEVQVQNWWPGCISCVEGSPRVTNFFFKVKNSRSDTAVEISSGIYGNECPSAFCPGRSTVNVWGHWSYTVEFRRTSGDLPEQEVSTDHAGQLQNNPGGNGCKFIHFYGNQQPTNTPVPTNTPPLQPTDTPVPPSPTIIVPSSTPQVGVPTATSYVPFNPTSTPYSNSPTNIPVNTQPPIPTHISQATATPFVIPTVPAIAPTLTPTPTPKPVWEVYIPKIKSTAQDLWSKIQYFLNNYIP
jgi:hypothetical protein